MSGVLKPSPALVLLFSEAAIAQSRLSGYRGGAAGGRRAKLLVSRGWGAPFSSRRAVIGRRQVRAGAPADCRGGRRRGGRQRGTERGDYPGSRDGCRVSGPLLKAALSGLLTHPRGSGAAEVRPSRHHRTGLQLIASENCPITFYDG